MYKLDPPHRGYVNTLDLLLKQCYTSPACHKSSPKRCYSTSAPVAAIHHEATDIAVLGGGITGLASAYYLSRELPNAKVTLLEGRSRLGGWLQTKTVDVGNGKVLFEQGPRNLRPSMPNGHVTLDLVSKLGLEHRLLSTKKNSAAAQNRFIYYPDHLVRMPGPGQSLLGTLFAFFSEPIFKGVLLGCCAEPFKPRRHEDLIDESVGSFLSRRFGPYMADNIASAVLHGIYAGDVYQLSVRSLLPRVWLAEWEDGSVLKGYIEQTVNATMPVLKEDIPFMEIPASINMEDASVFTFVGGLGELADKLASELSNNPNIKIHTGTWIKDLSLNHSDTTTQIEINRTCSSNLLIKENFTHVISTISGVNLDKIADVPPLAFTPSVTVMVVNLFFRSRELLPVHGFGYLIPRSIPYVENPEYALGVVFDSDATIGQDTIHGTKVTVMLGGHWWADMPCPDEDEGATMAKAVLKRHLGIDEEPAAVRVSLQRDCIPQYIVGHDERMGEASVLLDRKFGGRLRVAGNSYTGVGLNDCVRAARDVVAGLVEGTGRTGLDGFVGGRKWVWMQGKRDGG